MPAYPAMPAFQDRVEIWQAPLDPQKFSHALRKDFRAGAFVTFEGWVRNHNEGKEVARLEYEAYIPMAVKEIQKSIQKTKKKLPVRTIHVYHRVGVLNIGDIAVWIGVTGEHRKESFKACEMVMKELKTHAPIWKKEITLNSKMS
ncbi:MAG: molybdenum cofactor biosynthesis protein MoaE [Deltaproteobacteria bacterium]|nr:molybdenum cofactor biosynthesis protein MoaE [Deltaproteobacteria bacterium]